MSAPVYSIKIGDEGTAKTLAEAGLLAAVLTQRNRAPGSLALVFACAALAPQHLERVFVYRGDILIFTGTAHLPTQREEESQSVSVQVLDAWQELSDCPLTLPRQSWNATESALETVSTSRVLLGVNPATGAAETTGQTVSRIVAAAISKGAPTLALGSIMAGVQAPSSEIVDSPCSDALRQVLRWHPDAVAWVAASGAFHLQQASDLSEITLTGEGWEIDYASKAAPLGIRLVWERVNTTDGVARMERLTDQAGVLDSWPPPLEITLPLAGATVTSERVDVKTRTLPKSGVSDAVKAKFFRGLLPWLATATLTDLHIDDIEIEIVDPQEDDFNATEETVNPNSKAFPPGGATLDVDDYPRMLIAPGSLPGWTNAEAFPARIKGRISYKGTPTRQIAENLPLRRYSAAAGGTYLSGTIDEGITITNAAPKIYERISESEAGAAPVAGLATAFLASATASAVRGSVSGSDCQLGALVPGVKLTIAGKVSGVPVQESTLNLFSGFMTVAFGTPDHLSIDSLAELCQVGNANPPKWSRTQEHEDAETPANLSAGPVPAGGKLHASTVSQARSMPWDLQVSPSTIRVTSGALFLPDGSAQEISGAETDWTVAANDVLALKLTCEAGGITGATLEKTTVAAWERVSLSGAEIVAVRFPLWRFVAASAAAAAKVGAVTVSDSLVAERAAPFSNLLATQGYWETISGTAYLTVYSVPHCGHPDLT